MTVTYWALVEPALGETEHQPGGLFRVRDGITELLTGPKEWADRPELIKYVMLGESGAQPIDDARAQTLIDSFPWAGSRAARHANTGS